MKILLLILGTVFLLLGGLWLLQGIGAVHIKPILCVADCEPLQGPSPAWALVGLVVAALGALAIFRALKGRLGR